MSASAGADGWYQKSDGSRGSIPARTAGNPRVDASSTNDPDRLRMQDRHLPDGGRFAVANSSISAHPSCTTAPAWSGYGRVMVGPGSAHGQVALRGAFRARWTA